MEKGTYLASVLAELLRYKSLAEKAMHQLEAAQLFIAANEDSNSIAVIVQHLHGNMLSRFTDFLSSDGEKSWRQRDAEFDNHLEDKDVLFTLWNEGWECVFSAISPLTEKNLTDIVYIRSEAHTVTEAINRQLAHYPYHIGQIIFLAKIIKNKNWQNLSIPKGHSTAYNQSGDIKDPAKKY